MDIWWDRDYPNILRAHFIDNTPESNKNAVVDNVIMQIMTSEIGVHLIITKEHEVLTGEHLEDILNTVKLCIIQKNLKRFTIIHPYEITVPTIRDREIVNKWYFYSTLEEAYASLGVARLG